MLIAKAHIYQQGHSILYQHSSGHALSRESEIVKLQYLHGHTFMAHSYQRLKAIGCRLTTCSISMRSSYWLKRGLTQHHGLQTESIAKANPKMLTQFQYCEDNMIPLAAVIGQSELEEGVITLRDIATRVETKVCDAYTAPVIDPACRYSIVHG